MVDGGISVKVNVEMLSVKDGKGIGSVMNERVVESDETLNVNCWLSDKLEVELNSGVTVESVCKVDVGFSVKGNFDVSSVMDDKAVVSIMDDNLVESGKTLEDIFWPSVMLDVVLNSMGTVGTA